MFSWWPISCSPLIHGLPMKPVSCAAVRGAEGNGVVCESMQCTKFIVFCIKQNIKTKFGGGGSKGKSPRGISKVVDVDSCNFNSSISKKYNYLNKYKLHVFLYLHAIYIEIMIVAQLIYCSRFYGSNSPLPFPASAFVELVWTFFQRNSFFSLFLCNCRTIRFFRANPCWN